MNFSWKKREEQAINSDKGLSCKIVFLCDQSYFWELLAIRAWLLPLSRSDVYISNAKSLIIVCLLFSVFYFQATDWMVMITHPICVLELWPSKRCLIQSLVRIKRDLSVPRSNYHNPHSTRIKYAVITLIFHLTSRIATYYDLLWVRQSEQMLPCSPCLG